MNNLTIDFNRDVKSLKNGLRLNLNQIEIVIRLILRETIWMLLTSAKLKIKFGYDYYMYVTCEELSGETISMIEKTGLFVEPKVE